VITEVFNTDCFQSSGILVETPVFGTLNMSVVEMNGLGLNPNAIVSGQARGPGDGTRKSFCLIAGIVVFSG